MIYNDLKSNLESAGHTTRCNELKKWLEKAGFTVTRKTGNHHVVTHSGMDKFHSSSFDGGHGKNPPVKKPYFKKLWNVVDTHEAELRNFLGETK